MATPRKYEAGAPITCPLEAIKIAMDGGYIMLSDRPLHPGFVMAMQVNAIMVAARSGRIRHALEVKGRDK